ncbi:MAG: RDD family protein [Candidatus Methanosuratincola sp.]
MSPLTHEGAHPRALGEEVEDGLGEGELGRSPYEGYEDIRQIEGYEEVVDYGEAITLDLAGVGTRFAAYLMDVAILSVLSLLTVYLAMSVAGASGRVGQTVAMSFPVFLILYVLYFWILTAFGGQTLGKRVFGIRVVTDSGEEPGLGRSFLRVIGYFVSSAVFYLGFIWSIFDSRSQGWHDKIARTYVVRDQRDSP